MSEFDDRIKKLVKFNVVMEHKGFYLLKDNPALVERRINGNNKALSVLKKATKNAKFISQFPFVDGVFISGSLSKGFLDDDGDIDYFIVTKPNRLWVARTFLVAYKKVFLLNSRKYFCVNYFIDNKNLEIKDKNLFTATEVHSILPMVNNELNIAFKEENNWIKEFYPSHESIHSTNVLPLKKNAFAKFNEWVLKGSLGEFLDKKFMRITLNRWNKKFNMYSPEEFELIFRSERRVSKHHPSNYQKKVLESYQKKVKALQVKLDEQGII